MRKPSFGELESGRAVPPHLGQTDAIFKFWDLSKKPKKNVRLEKLGNLWAGFGAAVCDYDKKQNRASLATGLKKGQNSIATMEPDNWVFRKHANSIDRVWAVRLSAEHDEDASDRKHRSTMVIDNCGDQSWAFTMDQWWIKKLGASVGADLLFDSAGFTVGLCDDNVPTGQGTRACLMLNVSKSGGHVTDGPYAGQWWHTHTFKPPGGGGTIAAPAVGGACAETSDADWALRGDVNLLMGNDLMHIAMGSASETSGYCYSGKHWKHLPAPAPPSYEPATDPKSNQRKIDRHLEKGLWVYILKPPDDVPTFGLPPLREFPAPPGAIVVDTKSLPSSAGGAGGGFTYGNFPPGVTADDHFEINVPEIGGPSDLVIRIKYRLSVLLAGGEDVQLKLAWKVIPPSGDVPAAVTGYLDRTLTDADNPASASKHKTLIFTIKNFVSGPMRGGQLAIQFYRMGTLDSFPGTFKQQSGPAIHIRPRGTGQPIVKEPV